MSQPLLLGGIEVLGVQHLQLRETVQQAAVVPRKLPLGPQLIKVMAEEQVQVVHLPAQARPLDWGSRPQFGSQLAQRSFEVFVHFFGRPVKMEDADHGQNRIGA